MSLPTFLHNWEHSVAVIMLIGRLEAIDNITGGQHVPTCVAVNISLRKYASKFNYLTPVGEFHEFWKTSRVKS